MFSQLYPFHGKWNTALKPMASEKFTVLLKCRATLSVIPHTNPINLCACVK